MTKAVFPPHLPTFLPCALVVLVLVTQDDTSLETAQFHELTLRAFFCDLPVIFDIKVLKGSFSVSKKELPRKLSVGMENWFPAGFSSHQVAKKPYVCVSSNAVSVQSSGFSTKAKWRESPALLG